MNATSQALIRQIVEHVTCAVCGHHYGKSDVQILGRREQVWAMKVQCRECRTKSLLLAVVNDTGTRPVYTDLVPDEWERFRESPPVSVDDVVRAHEYLQGYEGDFTDILEDPLPEE